MKSKKVLLWMFCLMVMTPVALAQSANTTATDPAVKAGRVTVEIHPWLVAKEVWP